MKKWVCVKVPASTSNLGPGFDVLGLALGLYNEVELEIVNRVSGKNGSRLEIEIEGEGKNSLPRDERNLIWKAALKTFHQLKFATGRFGFRLKAKNRIPLARGLGSSAAAILAGSLAANALAHNKLSKDEILKLAVGMEGHPDNLAAQLFGGFCIADAIGDGIDVIKLKPPKHFVAVLCVPEFELSTKIARKALPPKIPHRDGVANVGRIALFLGKLFSGEFKNLKAVMEDRLHQPYRKHLIPGFDLAVEKGYQAGAHGVALSGAGPSIFAFAEPSKADRVGTAMEKGFSAARIKAKSLVLDFDLKGAETASR